MNAVTSPRRLMLFCGPQTWGEEVVARLVLDSKLPADEVYWHQSNDSAFSILGQDRTLTIINAYQGLHPDVIGRTVGTITAGGALAIICPPLEEWPTYADPQIPKLIPYSNQHQPIKSHYLQRWSKLLGELEGVEHYTPNDTHPINPIKRALFNLHLNKACTPDQQAAIDAVIKTVTGQRRRPAILTADRGRGKSAAMGLAAAHLIACTKAPNIIITSSGFNQVSNVFKHAQAALKKSSFDRTLKCLQHESGSIRYVAPDRLINHYHQKPSECDLILVDEAAALGVPRLKKLLTHFTRIAFASTEHGYEGSGRGFSVKFKQLVRQHCRGHHAVELTTPIRWSDQDPLEQWTNQLLLLKANDTTQPSKVPALTTLDFKPISQSSLAADEALLHKVFSLLVDAHYQTRPIDLRYLLDAPNAELWLAQSDGQIVGLVWLMHEGELNKEIANDIVIGHRRPRGHLVPQILAAHLGLPEAASLRCARIQRIAVNPAMQNRGIGSWMLNQLKDALKRNADYLASSFGADLPLLRFWDKAGYDAIRLSDKTNLASGLHSAVVMQALTASAIELQKKAQAQFVQQFPIQLMGSLHCLAPDLACHLAKNKAYMTQTDSFTLEAAVLFAFAARPYESSLSAIYWLAKMALFNPRHQSQLSTTQQHLFIMRSLQCQGWTQCAQQLGIGGKMEAVQLLRQGVQQILAHHIAADQLALLKAKFNLLT